MGEFEIIARYFTRASGRADVLLGVGDDAAVLAPPAGARLVVAIDTIVEDVHFPRGFAAADIGYRSLAVNLSDLAAMGAQPSWMTLSISLPQSYASERWLEAFATGLFELADRFDVALVGGDTVRGPLVITVQIGGVVEADRWLTRSGARAGDRLFASGSLGDAAAGLALIQQDDQQGRANDWLCSRFRRPSPRIELGRALRPFASAAMDVSDGLLTDLNKLCAASSCGAELDLDTLPLSPALQQLYPSEEQRRFALAGGDDYELLFTIPAERAEELAMLRSECAITQIGVITSTPGVRCMSAGRTLDVARGGYDHFAQDADG